MNIKLEYSITEDEFLEMIESVGWKTYTKEQIEAVVRKEVDDKYGKVYMQNFSTFLNNFPDPSIMEDHSKEHSKKEEKLIIGGVEYK